jgi:DNA-binding response OmpR family regulator
LLTAFVRHRTSVLHEQLLDLAWERFAEQVKLYVGYLRRKLSPDAPARTPIETRRGFGYAYRPRRAV